MNFWTGPIVFQFQNILKPAYNSIDMVEVELLDDDSEPREFSRNLLEVCCPAIQTAARGVETILMFAIPMKIW